MVYSFHGVHSGNSEETLSVASHRNFAKDGCSGTASHQGTVAWVLLGSVVLIIHGPICLDNTSIFRSMHGVMEGLLSCWESGGFN